MNTNDKLQNNFAIGEVNWKPGSDSRLEKLGEGFYNATNYGFGNVGIVITNEGVVVIDSTISRTGGKAIVDEITKMTDQPIKYLIYTHGHGDHVGGASVLKEQGATVISHRNVIERFNRYTKLRDHHVAINSMQFKRKQKIKNEYIYPDIVYDFEYTFELGGKTFRLLHGKGETDDATVVYIPEDKICYSGDFIVWSFPNIGNPNKVLRYEREWYEMLDRILKLNPKAIAPGHGRSLLGNEEVQACLSDTSAVLKYLHEECVMHINQGSSLDKMLHEISIPEELANSPYIKQSYGCLEFVIRGIHRRYTGWYDGNPTNLSPSPINDVNQAILDLIGNQEKIIESTRYFVSEGNLQLALHLIDLILTENPSDKEMHAFKGELLEQMSEVSNNLFFRNFYTVSANNERELAE
ncbi:MBL fold metallo-hydrolase [Salicibibacter cibarius]|uniref:MBL fold metallo-hydrolase n=1 Tax=Salicibibacter cibarius TaxID=2743000 RepID=A0A7T7CC74_9BACI|nr:alkyl sulfatase dimerization domain-containing protein [Salicibibacter cibarius]QQK76579.1 MBL fold metallo-hydrolase [Salicibibacter cibarius]